MACPAWHFLDVRDLHWTVIPGRGYLGLLYLYFREETGDGIALFIHCFGSGVGLFWFLCSDPCRERFLQILALFKSFLSLDPFDPTLRFNLGSSHPALPLLDLRPLLSSLEVFLYPLNFPRCDLLDLLLDIYPSYSVST
ncbi:hypothetical protein TNCV_2348031 [Trichonephila clavipes]|uniref:Uncharacterized protein n=1 Tax=Trichonephila clavipes TaxID=2585209 RepID=A0A8X6T0I4_TRICX|nr:hypothetical protein TNCV_2348031 [Trichonephila clavipes]